MAHAGKGSFDCASASHSRTTGPAQDDRCRGTLPRFPGRKQIQNLSQALADMLDF